MILARRLLLVLALVAALPALAREPPYLGARDLDLVAILPPPSVDRAQEELVLAAQRAASAERIEQARRDVDESIDTGFGPVFGKALDARSLPATTRLFARLDATERAIVSPAKKAFKRVRPYLSNPQIKALVRPSISGSYPSGHTTYITVAAIMVATMVPEKRDAIWQRADDYAHSRVIGGMHYPDDLSGGRLAGTAIAAALQSRPEFKADFEAARHELRAFLGLPL